MDSWLPKIPSVPLDDSSRIAEAQVERDEWKKMYEELRDEHASAAALRERDELVTAISVELENTKRAMRNATAESDARLKEAKVKAKDLIQQKMKRAEEEKGILRQTLTERELEAQELRDQITKRNQQVSEAVELKGQISELGKRYADSQQTVQSLKAKLTEIERNRRAEEPSKNDGEPAVGYNQELLDANETIGNLKRQLEEMVQSENIQEHSSATKVEESQLELAKQASEAQSYIAHLKEELDRVKSDKSLVEGRLSKSEQEKAELSHKSLEADELRGTVSRLEQENYAMTEKVKDMENTINNSSSESSTLVHSLQQKLHEMEKEAESKEQVSMSPVDDAPVDESNSSLSAMSEKAARLEKQLDESELALKEALQRLDERAVVSDANHTNSDTAEPQVFELKGELAKCREELDEERHRNTALRQQLSDQSQTPDDNKIRSERADLEGQLAAKTSELTKTKEKAKVYLREINAEKTKLQEKMDGALAEATARGQEADDKVAAKIRESAKLSRELEGALGVIMEKQSALDSLKQQMSSARRNSEDAQEQVIAVQREFSNYKEKARKALAERDNVIADSDSAVATATSDLKSQLERLSQDLTLAQAESSRIPELERTLESQRTVIERAEKALAAAQGMDAPDTNDSQKIMELEDSVADLQIKLSKAEYRVTEAESQFAGMSVRLEISQKTVKGLQEEIVRQQATHSAALELKTAEIDKLSSNLRDASASTRAAQRTAAAAAMAFDPSTGSPGLPVMRKASSSSPGAHGRSDDFVLTSPAVSDTNQEELLSLRSELSRVRESLLESQKAQSVQKEVSDALNRDLRELESRYKAAQNLKEGLPFEYLKNTVTQFLETDDLETMLPVFKTILSFSPAEIERIRERRRSRGADRQRVGGMFGFLGGSS